MKKKKLTNSEEIAKLYTDTYRTRMPLYNDYVFHRIYGSDTEVTEIMTIEEEMNIRWHYGYDEGEAAGLEKGAAQEKREIAKSMIEEGIAKEVIEKITGLSMEEVEAL